jgi:hypothetical protein
VHELVVVVDLDVKDDGVYSRRGNSARKIATIRTPRDVATERIRPGRLLVAWQVDYSHTSSDQWIAAPARGFCPHVD